MVEQSESFLFDCITNYQLTVLPNIDNNIKYNLLTSKSLSESNTELEI